MVVIARLVELKLSGRVFRFVVARGQVGAKGRGAHRLRCALLTGPGQRRLLAPSVTPGPHDVGVTPRRPERPHHPEIALGRRLGEHESAPLEQRPAVVPLHRGGRGGVARAGAAELVHRRVHRRHRLQQLLCRLRGGGSGRHWLLF